MVEPTPHDGSEAAPQSVMPLPKAEAQKRLTDRARQLPSRVRNQVKKAMKARRYTLHECLVNRDWRNTANLTTVVVSRKMPGGSLAVASFMIDLACLGVKDAIFKTALAPEDYADLKRRVRGYQQDLVPCPPPLAMRIVDHAVRYALALGFLPEDDYFPCVKLLDSFDPDDSDEPIPLGDGSGKPMYISGPHDDVDSILTTLEANVGPDGFEFVLAGM